VRVGLLLPLNSGVSAAAASALKGAQLAAEEVGAGGEFRLELLVEDDRGSAERALASFARMAEDGRVGAVVGGLTDSVAVALSPQASRRGLPVVSPGATGEVPYAGHYFFRTALPASLQGPALARYALRRGWRAGVIYDSNDYGTGVALSFVRAVQEGGGVVVGQRLYRDGTRDFSRFVRAVQEEGPDVVLLAGYPDEGNLFLEQAGRAGVRLSVLAPDSYANPEAVRAAGGWAHGMVVAAAFFPEDPLPRVRAFVRQYQQRFGSTPDAFAAQAYDAVKIVGFALKRAGAVRPDGRVDRERLRNALAALRDYPGVTGVLAFDRFGNPAREVLLLQVDRTTLRVLR
jgi:branched-chain amino acid transport system substrate-binding protein